MRLGLGLSILAAIMCFSNLIQIKCQRDGQIHNTFSVGRSLNNKCFDPSELRRINMMT